MKLRLGAAYRLLDEKLIVLAEYESRFETVRSSTVEVSLLGGTPGVVTSSDEITLQESVVRFGAEYRIIAPLWLRIGLDRIGSGASGEIIPTGGFALEYGVGELGTRFDYTFGKEAFGLGTFHLIGVHFTI